MERTSRKQLYIVAILASLIIWVLSLFLLWIDFFYTGDEKGWLTILSALIGNMPWGLVIFPVLGKIAPTIVSGNGPFLSLSDVIVNSAIYLVNWALNAFILSWLFMRLFASSKR